MRGLYTMTLPKARPYFQAVDQNMASLKYDEVAFVEV